MRKLYIDYICLRYVVLFSKRNLRYAWIALLLIMESIPNWSEKRILRTGYCFLQVVDDILDGDLPVEGEPLDIVDAVVNAIHARQFDDSKLMLLAEAFLVDIEKNLDNTYLEKVLTLIMVMQKDRKRAIEQSCYSKEQLNSHHFKTFSLSLDLLFGARKSELKSNDVEELIMALGWCSTVRDLKADISIGIINIPKEVLLKAPHLQQPFIYDEVIKHPSIIEWLINERLQAIAWLDQLEIKKQHLKKKHGYDVVSIFSNSARQIASKRFFKLYPHLKAYK